MSTAYTLTVKHNPMGTKDYTFSKATSFEMDDTYHVQHVIEDKPNSGLCECNKREFKQMVKESNLFDL